VAKTLEAKLRNQHAVLEKHVANQSAKLQRAGDKATVETGQRRENKHGAQKPASPNKK
jgi:hypothetical protein